MISAENKPVTVTAMTGARIAVTVVTATAQCRSYKNGCLSASPKRRQRHHSRRKARRARCSRAVTATATASITCSLMIAMTAMTAVTSAVTTAVSARPLP